jgi:hypothetical protein
MGGEAVACEYRDCPNCRGFCEFSLFGSAMSCGNCCWLLAANEGVLRDQIYCLDGGLSHDEPRLRQAALEAGRRRSASAPLLPILATIVRTGSGSETRPGRGDMKRVLRQQRAEEYSRLVQSLGEASAPAIRGAFCAPPDRPASEAAKDLSFRRPHPSAPLLPAESERRLTSTESDGRDAHQHGRSIALRRIARRESGTVIAFGRARPRSLPSVERHGSK